MPLPPPTEGETPLDLLKPGGQNVGERGDNSKIRILPGELDEARELFDRLTKGKSGMDVTSLERPGQVIRLPNGSYIGLRPKSKSGPPTIDVNVAGTGVRELKFPGGNAQ